MQSTCLYRGRSYQVCFPRRKTLHGYEDKETDQGEEDESLSGSCLRRATVSMAQISIPRGQRETHNDTVVPGEDGELVEACDQIPSGSDVASYEDTKGEDGKRVHRIALRLWHEHPYSSRCLDFGWREFRGSWRNGGALELCLRAMQMAQISEAIKGRPQHFL